MVLQNLGLFQGMFMEKRISVKRGLVVFRVLLQVVGFG